MPASAGLVKPAEGTHLREQVQSRKRTRQGGVSFEGETHLRKALLISLIAASLLVAAGCGGGSETPPPSTTPGGGTTAGGVPPPPPIAATKPQASEEVSTPVKFEPTAETPAAFKKLLTKKKIIVVEFFLAADPVTADVAKEIAPLKRDFKKQVIFVSFDVNNAAKTAAISEQLKAGFAPYFVILDKGGFIVYRHSGFIDRLTLEQQIFSTLRR